MRMLTGLLLLAAVPAGAQTSAPGWPERPAAPAAPPVSAAARPPMPMGGMQIFLSPMGEPFRAPEGEPYPVAAWFAAADTDHDGKLTRAELRADALRFFATLDVNHDGVIDGAEIERYETEVAPEVHSGWAETGGRRDGGSGESGGGHHGGGHRGGRGGGGMGAGGMGGGGMGRGGGMDGGGEPDVAGASDTNGGSGENSYSAHRAEQPAGGGRFGLLNIPEPVVATDVLLNRRITAKEFAEAADRRFGLLDPDDRGELTLATLPHTPAQDRSPRRRR